MQPGPPMDLAHATSRARSAAAGSPPTAPPRPPRSSRARSAQTSPGSAGHRTTLRWPTFQPAQVAQFSPGADRCRFCPGINVPRGTVASQAVSRAAPPRDLVARAGSCVGVCLLVAPYTECLREAPSPGAVLDPSHTGTYPLRRRAIRCRDTEPRRCRAPSQPDKGGRYACGSNSTSSSNRAPPRGPRTQSAGKPRTSAAAPPPDCGDPRLTKRRRPPCPRTRTPADDGSRRQRLRRS